MVIAHGPNRGYRLNDNSSPRDGPIEIVARSEINYWEFACCVIVMPARSRDGDLSFARLPTVTTVGYFHTARFPGERSVPK